jgi:hypothetical protein
MAKLNTDYKVGDKIFVLLDDNCIITGSLEYIKITAEQLLYFVNTDVELTSKEYDFTVCFKSELTAKNFINQDNFNTKIS